MGNQFRNPPLKIETIIKNINSVFSYAPSKDIFVLLAYRFFVTVCSSFDFLIHTYGSIMAQLMLMCI